MQSDSKQPDIDWRRVYTKRLAACCTQAAKDHNLEVQCPYSLCEDDGSSKSFIALFPSIGGGKGLLVCLANEWSIMEPLALRHGFSCAGLDAEHYSSYSRPQWTEILQAWNTPAESP
jgi:hypothetical protein